MEHGGTPKPQLEKTSVGQEQFDGETVSWRGSAIVGTQIEIDFEDVRNMGERWHAGA